MGNTVVGSERSLVTSAKAGDRAAFSLLVGQYMQRVYRLACTMVHNGEDAGDIAQEVFVRMYRGLSRFDDERPLFPWLYRITRNLCINRSVRGRRESELADPETVADRAEGPEEQLVGDEERRRVREAIASLPEHYRQIIELNHFEECSYAEIAAILDIPIGTVMSRLYHARRKLRAVLEGDGSKHDGRR